MVLSTCYISTYKFRLTKKGKYASITFFKITKMLIFDLGETFVLIFIVNNIFSFKSLYTSRKAVTRIYP